MIGEKKLNVVIVGYGMSGKQFHSYLVPKTKHLNLYGVVSSKNIKNVKIFKNLEDSLKDENVHVIIVATPTNSHKEIIIKSLQHDKDVLSDKPICLTQKDFLEIIDTLKKSKGKLSVFQNRRQDGDYLTVKKLMEENILGKVRWIEVSWQKYGVPTKKWKQQPTKEGGGYFYDLGVHLLDQVLLLFPQGIKSVFSRIHYDFEGFEGMDSHSIIVIEFVDGVTAILDLSTSVTIQKPRFYIVGSKGSFIKYGIDPQEAAMIKEDIESAQEEEKWYGTFKKTDMTEEKIPTVRGNWLLFYENFENFLVGKEENQIKLGTIYRTIVVLENAILSSEKKQVIELNLPSAEEVEKMWK